MKKLLLSVLTLMSVSVFAQRLSINLVEPASGTQIYNGQSTTFEFYVKNLSVSDTSASGSDSALLATDTIVFRFGRLLQTSQGIVFQQISPTPPNFTILSHTGIAAGDSVSFTRNYTLTMSPDMNEQAALAFILYRVVDGVPSEQSLSYKLYTLYNSLTEIEEAASSLKLYPNPAVDVLNIELDYNKTATVRILDITGKVIGTQALENGAAQVDVSSLAKGIYIYELSSENQVIKTGKFSVAR